MKTPIYIFLCGIILASTLASVGEEEQSKPSTTITGISTPNPTMPVKILTTTPTPTEPSSKKPELTPAEESARFLLQSKFAPPLSIFESIRLTENVILLLNPSVEKFKGPRKELAMNLINLIIDHVKLTDDRVSSLLYYRWYNLGQHKVSDDDIEEDIYKPQPPIRNVSALSFEATGADVFVHHMKVVDIQNNAIRFNINKWIIDGLPHKEVCYLYFPTTIKSIILDHSTKKKAKAHLKVFAGITDRTEYGKAALYYLTRGRKAVESDSFADAVTELKSARNTLIQFNRQQRFEPTEE